MKLFGARMKRAEQLLGNITITITFWAPFHFDYLYIPILDTHLKILLRIYTLYESILQHFATSYKKDVINQQLKSRL